MNGDPRRDDETRDRLDEIDAGYKARAEENRSLILHVAQRTRWTLRVVIVVLVLQGVAGYLIRNHSNNENSKRINEVAALARNIQQSRKDAILETCREQNARNRVAYLFLKALPPSPGERQLSPKDKVRLIHGFTDAVVGPARDCEARARQLVR